MGSFVPCAPAASPTYCRRILTSRPSWCWIPQSMARELRRLQRRAPIALTDRCWGSGTCSERHIVISYGCWVARVRPPRDSSVRCEGGWEGGRFVRADVEGGREGGSVPAPWELGSSRCFARHSAACCAARPAMRETSESGESRRRAGDTLVVGAMGGAQGRRREVGRRTVGCQGTHPRRLLGRVRGG